MTRLLPILTAAAIAVAGCGATHGAASAAGTCDSGTCPAGQSCVNNHCTVTPITDAIGEQDAAPSDGGTDAGGDGSSAGDFDAGPAETAIGPALPTWKLKDINPASAGYGTTYGLEKFAGKRTILGMWAGWSAAAIAMADVASPFAENLPAEAASKVAFAAIVAPSQPELLLTHVGAMPLFVDAWSNHTFIAPDGEHTAEIADVLAYGVDGRLIGWFEGNGTVYTKTFGEFLQAVVAAPDSQTWFMFCATGGKSGCKVTE